MRNHPVSETYSKIFGYRLFYHYLGSFTALTTDVEAGCGIFGVDSHTLEVEVLSFAIGNVGCYGVDSGCAVFLSDVDCSDIALAVGCGMIGIEFECSCPVDGNGVVIVGIALNFS